MKRPQNNILSGQYALGNPQYLAFVLTDIVNIPTDLAQHKNIWGPGSPKHSGKWPLNAMDALTALMLTILRISVR